MSEIEPNTESNTESNTSDPGPEELLLFRPFAFQYHVWKAFHQVPRYLFRVYSERSAGTTDLASVTTPAWTCDRPERKIDLFDMVPRDAAKLLSHHFAWVEQHEAECNLMSWTSSLLFAIQGGIYRYQTDKPKVSLSDIFILVVDTTEFPKGTFLKDLEACEAFDRYDLFLRNLHTPRKRDKYFGEYLSQGKLKIEGRSTRTSLQHMLRLGVFNICPKMRDRERWVQWQGAVVQLRSAFLQEPEVATVIEVQKAIRIGRECFGDDWALPIATMLLSFKIRLQSDPVIMAGLRATYTDEEITSLSLSDGAIDCQLLPEVEQYRDLVRDLYCNTKQVKAVADVLLGWKEIQMRQRPNPAKKKAPFASYDPRFEDIVDPRCRTYIGNKLQHPIPCFSSYSGWKDTLVILSRQLQGDELAGRS